MDSSSSPSPYEPSTRRSSITLIDLTEESDGHSDGDSDGETMDELALSDAVSDIHAQPEHAIPHHSHPQTAASATFNATIAPPLHDPAHVLESWTHYYHERLKEVQQRRERLVARTSPSEWNDLKLFSQNFKLSTPIPGDLVPILARDEGKRKVLVERALENSQIAGGIRNEDGDGNGHGNGNGDENGIGIESGSGGGQAGKPNSNLVLRTPKTIDASHPRTKNVGTMSMAEKMAEYGFMPRAQKKMLDKEKRRKQEMKRISEFGKEKKKD